MFDFDVGKLVVIGVVALIVIGPKDLPRVLRQVGQAVGKMRRMAAEFQGQFMEAMREADVENLKKEVQSAADLAKVDVAFDPVRDVNDQITAAVEGDVTPGPALPVETPAVADLGIDHPPPPARLAVESAFEDAPATILQEAPDTTAPAPRSKLAVAAAFEEASGAPHDPLEAKIAARDAKLTGEPATEAPAALAEKRA